MVPRWASDVTVLRLNTGITVITSIPASLVPAGHSFPDATGVAFALGLGPPSLLAAIFLIVFKKLIHIYIYILYIYIYILTAHPRLQLMRQASLVWTWQAQFTWWTQAHHRPFAGDRRRRQQLTQAHHSREIDAAVRGSPKPAADSIVLVLDLSWTRQRCTWLQS